MSFKEKAIEWEQRAYFLLSGLSYPKKFISLPAWSLDKENPRLGMGKEDKGDGKEGRELLDFLAGDQKQIVPEPGIVRGQRQEQPKKADEEHYHPTWLHKPLLNRNWCVSRILEDAGEI